MLERKHKNPHLEVTLSPFDTSNDSHLLAAKFVFRSVDDWIRKTAPTNQTLGKYRIFEIFAIRLARWLFP